jgi:hypothetical protein
LDPQHGRRGLGIGWTPPYIHRHAEEGHQPPECWLDPDYNTWSRKTL